MRVCLLAPIASSLYSRLLVHELSRCEGVNLVSIIVRSPWSLKRIRSELRRDGSRLLRKAYKKLVVREETIRSRHGETLGDRAQRVGLPDGNLKYLAKRHRIECISVRDHNDSVVIRHLKREQPDLLVFSGGGLIRAPLLALTRLGILNCHMGMLPEYRGMDVIEYPVLEGRIDDPGLGMTLHFMDAGVDTGPILLRQEIPITTNDTFETIRERVGPMMVDLVVKGVERLARGDIASETQRLEEGRQYYVMHRRLEEAAHRRLSAYTKIERSE